MAGKSPSRGSRLPETDWSQIRDATCADPAVARPALDKLLRAYWPALCRHIEIRFAIQREQAEELVQDFIADRILSAKLLHRANQQQGRFRNLILTALDRSVIDELRRANRRPPRREFDAERLADSDRLVFDCVWAQSVIVNALQRMRSECKRKGRSSEWRIFFKRLVEPLVEPDKAPSMAELARECGLATAKQAANLLVSAKRRFQSRLMDVVGEYVLDGEPIEAELLDLCRTLAENHVARTSGSFDAHSSIMDSDLWSSVESADSLSLQQLMGPVVAPPANNASPADWLEFECQRLARLTIVEHCQCIQIPHGLDMDSLKDVTVLDLLMSPDPHGDALYALKRIFRYRSRQPLRSQEVPVTRLMYMATIASAFVAHGELISKSPRGEILAGWNRLLEIPWLSEGIRSILQRACDGLQAAKE